MSDFGKTRYNFKVLYKSIFYATFAWWILYFLLYLIYQEANGISLGLLFFSDQDFT